MTCSERNHIAKVNDSTKCQGSGAPFSSVQLVPQTFTKNQVIIRLNVKKQGHESRNRDVPSQFSKHSQAEGNVGGYYRREVSAWFNGRLVKGVTTKSRASKEIAWNNWQGGKMEEFPGRK